MLTGGTAHLPGFADELNRLIGVRVRVGDPLNRVAIPKKFREPDEIARLAGGRDRPRDRGLMRAVNLLPRDDASQGRRLPPLPVLIGVHRRRRDHRACSR